MKMPSTICSDMRFSVDLQKKKEIQKKYIKSRKGESALSVGIIGDFILFTIYFLYYGLIREDTFLIRDVTDSGYGEKNTLLVWTILIAADVILAFLWVIQRIVVYRIFGVCISGRADESLVIEDDVLKYGYQNAAYSHYWERVIVQTPIANIKENRVDKHYGRIEIFGSISSKYYEDYPNRITRAPENSFTDGSFVLFDYFDPGLLQFFEDKCKAKIREK